MQTALLLVLAALATPALRPQDAAEVRAADELYPPAAQLEVVRFLVVKTDEPDVGEINAALRELEAQIIYGPRTTEARPGRAFVAVRAPHDLPASKLERALRKGGAAAQELVCTAFAGRDDRDSQVAVMGFNFTTRDFVMGMSGDIVWFDSAGGWSQFYGPRGKLEADELADRYAKLYGPYGGGKLGSLVRERFTWTLAVAPDEKRAKRLLDAVRKLEGVSAAALDGPALSVEVALDGLASCGVAGQVPSGADPKAELDKAGVSAPRACFSTRPLWDLLAAEGLAPLSGGEAGRER